MLMGSPSHRPSLYPFSVSPPILSDLIRPAMFFFVFFLSLSSFRLHARGLEHARWRIGKGSCSRSFFLSLSVWCHNFVSFRCGVRMYVAIRRVVFFFLSRRLFMRAKPVGVISVVCWHAGWRTAVKDQNGANVGRISKTNENKNKQRKIPYHRSFLSE